MTLRELLEKFIRHKAKQDHAMIEDSLAIKWEYVAAYTAGANTLSAQTLKLAEALENMIGDCSHKQVCSCQAVAEMKGMQALKEFREFLTKEQT